MNNDTEEYNVKIEQIKDKYYGECIRETWSRKDGVIHREEEPAVILRYKKGEKPFQEEWYYNGQLHRKNAPARVFNNAIIKKEEWFEYGIAHRNNGSAVLEILSSTGLVTKEEWIKHGKEHRIGAPSLIMRDQDTGIVTLESWQIDGKLHRNDDPAYIERHEETGIMILEMWFFNDKLHRHGNPAEIERDWQSGKIFKAVFSENGVEINSSLSNTPNL
ncbi:MAG: hypothetical protein KAJ86_08385 [Alphaproteobacteria bacterium]|nr:hypothetical protein [Alphaproteobacteria bacterium]